MMALMVTLDVLQHHHPGEQRLRSQEQDPARDQDEGTGKLLF